MLRQILPLLYCRDLKHIAVSKMDSSKGKLLTNMLRDGHRGHFLNFSQILPKGSQPNPIPASSYTYRTHVTS